MARKKLGEKANPNKDEADLPVGAVLLLRMGGGDCCLARVLQKGVYDTDFQDRRLCLRLAVSKWIGKREDLDLKNEECREIWRYGKDRSYWLIDWVMADKLPQCIELIKGRLPPQKNEVVGPRKAKQEVDGSSSLWSLFLRFVDRKHYSKYAETKRKRSAKEARERDRAAKKLLPKIPKHQIRIGPRSGNYSIGRGEVLYRGRAIKDADPATFRELTPFWGVDARGAYAEGKLAAGISPADVRVLSAIAIGDGKNVYVTAAPASLDAASFTVLDPGVTYRDGICASPRFEGYVRDCRNIFFVEHESGSLLKVDGADHASFRPLINGFALDSDHAYFRGKAIEGAMLGMWHEVGQGYSADAQRVYWRTQCVPKAKTSSFQPLALDGVDLGMDGARHFHESQEISREAWVKLAKDDLEKTAKRLRDEFGVEAELKTPPRKA